MPTSRGRVNRGPAAAAENRQAILDAARRLFHDRGYHVPLNAIAKAAGVGQAVLYRHFPSRLDLALAVFEENLGRLEQVAAEPDAGAFARLWATLVEQTVESAAFVEMAVDARRSLPDYSGAGRLQAMLTTTLSRAQAAGVADPQLTVEDVLLAHRMVYGVIATEADPAHTRAAVDRALGLLGCRLGL